ncbi:efflux RND transporter periplasmic adaptor subunit [Raineyella fluvialis]|uniref:Efflux RND transporter periplasmic adaptor subunit n=1 Tax=Raineyella fluvialis TaxID=2662261 RepID=A0A5Q2FCY2_9ACTN|nr:efflux RND transporter periplasmic adaptor subunit [Raineyella fluvialis]QGF23627.1 efflux RND transporter periplasmic adaptor subunit [Raineyella fluvialis]
MTGSTTAQQAPRRTRRRRRLIAGVVVAVVVLALVAGYVMSQRGARTTVTTATASTQRLSVTVSASGTVEAASLVPVYSPIAGTLASVRVSDGQVVKAGDELATLDTAALSTAVAQAQAQVAAAEAQAGSASAQLALARAMPHDTDAQTRTRDAAIQAANAAHDAAVAARSAASAGLRAARDNAAKASITAPVGGTVTLNVLAATRTDGTGPKAAAGASVGPTVPLFTIADLGHPVFAAQVDEADIAHVAVGQQSTVTLDAYPGRTFPGAVSEVATTSVSTKTGGVAYIVKIPLAAGDAVLRLGMSGDASLATQDIPDALVVPLQAVQADGAQRWVYKVTDGTAHRTPVTVGASSATQAQITSGLAAGDVVATSQLSALKDGASVDVGK